jgi:hypothetical protein
VPRLRQVQTGHDIGRTAPGCVRACCVCVCVLVCVHVCKIRRPDRLSRPAVRSRRAGCWPALIASTRAHVWTFGQDHQNAHPLASSRWTALAIIRHRPLRSPHTRAFVRGQGPAAPLALWPRPGRGMSRSRSCLVMSEKGIAWSISKDQPPTARMPSHHAMIKYVQYDI